MATLHILHSRFSNTLSNNISIIDNSIILQANLQLPLFQSRPILRLHLAKRLHQIATLLEFLCLASALQNTLPCTPLPPAKLVFSQLSPLCRDCNLARS